MPFESQWARIPLAIRWSVSLFIAVVLIVLLVLFVTHNSSNGEATLSRAGLQHEARLDATILGQDQAPKSVHVRSAATARGAVVAGVRAEMRRRISSGNIDGPLTSVRCGESGHRGDRIAYHCLADAGNVNYPFLALATPTTHRAVFCKKDFPPVRSENIPVSRRCRL